MCYSRGALYTHYDIAALAMYFYSIRLSDPECNVFFSIACLCSLYHTMRGVVVLTVLYFHCIGMALEPFCCSTVELMDVSENIAHWTVYIAMQPSLIKSTFWPLKLERICFANSLICFCTVFYARKFEIFFLHSYLFYWSV